ncbi:MAG: transglycosylase SLT domain-containing protein [Phormidesmis sp.]
MKHSAEQPPIEQSPAEQLPVKQPSAEQPSAEQPSESTRERNMLKTLRNRWPLIVLVAISTLSIGLVVALLKTTDAFTTADQSAERREIEAIQSAERSTVLGLVNLPEAERAATLLPIAQGAAGLERDRARYMLATDYINQGNSEQALPLLDGLADSYQPLSSYVLLKQAQAQAALDQRPAAIKTWNQLTRSYPESAATAEALYQLGLPPVAKESSTAGPVADPSAWAALLERFPAHPLSIQVAFRQLDNLQPAADEGATALPLLRNIAYYGLEHPQYLQALNRLVDQYGSALTPEDWAAVGFGYWETQNYAEAGDAYAKATGTPTSQYRAARGKERGGKRKEAIAYYKQLNLTFPTAPETANGLLNLADLQPNEEAIATLDNLITRFPDSAGEALAKRAEILDALKSPDSAKQARASILSQHSDSAAAAKIRFRQAEANAAASNYGAAISWAKQLVDAAPNDELAAEAGFWLGRWTLKQNQPDAARQAFEQVIINHPESYYAWRSAIYLDWNVGNFDTVRAFQPEIELPSRRTLLPTGSEALQELYLLGHNQTAWNQWQNEFITPQTPTVGQQFTDGVLRLGVGDNLEGLFMVSSLAWRESPEEIAEYEAIKNQPSFWQALYPFPFPELILGWAQERALNPLLVTALVRQESRFQADIRSVVGAVGLMQVMPATGEWISDQIGQTDYTLDQPADNVKFGTWYLDFTHREYDNNSLFAVASYNAGPGAVAQWIAEKDFTNADEFVEQIPYPETKGYVESVFGGYWNYLRLYDPAIAAKINAL